MSNKIADKIIRTLPYTMVAGACCGSVLCGYIINSKDSYFPIDCARIILCGAVVGSTWPVVIPLGAFAWSGYQIASLSQKYVKDKD